MIVIDSVAALTPKAEIEGDMGDSHVGLQARLMSQALRKLTAIVNKSKIVKNKLAPPFKQAEFDIVFGEGISQEGCIMDMGIQFDIIGKSGAWFSYNGEKVANGREKMRQFLKDNPEISAEIQQKIRAAAKGASEIIEGASDTSEAD